MIRKIARPMLASVFVYDGVDTLRNATERVEETETVLSRARSVVPSQYAGYIPNDPELVARAVGGAKVGAGTLLALGKAPRTSAAVLALSSLPSLLGRNAFWEAESSQEKADRRTGFLTSTALLGALFIATQDREGKPSLAWRARKAGEHTNAKISQALPTKSESQKFADNLSDRASEYSSKASDWIDDTASKTQAYVEDNKDDWEETGRSLIDTAKSYVEDAVDYFDSNKDEWLEKAQDNADVARKGAVKAAAKAQDRANSALESVESVDGKRAAKKASKQVKKLQKQASKKIDKAYKKYGDRI